MKFEKQLFKTSIKEIIWLFLIHFAVMNLFAGIIGLIKGSTNFITYALLIVFFPLANAIIFGITNRNGVLKISAFADKSIVKEKIESAMKMNAYTKEIISEGHHRYSNTSKRNKIYNYFFQQTLDVKYEDDVILVFAKRNFLRTIEMTLEYGK
jgi:hypothetical protein